VNNGLGLTPSAFEHRKGVKDVSSTPHAPGMRSAKQLTLQCADEWGGDERHTLLATTD
jgi:hypothetical protein